MIRNFLECLMLESFEQPDSLLVIEANNTLVMLRKMGFFVRINVSSSWD
jgi:hypothetical protein